MCAYGGRRALWCHLYALCRDDNYRACSLTRYPVCQSQFRSSSSSSLSGSRFAFTCACSRWVLVFAYLLTSIHVLLTIMFVSRSMGHGAVFVLGHHLRVGARVLVPNLKWSRRCRRSHLTHAIKLRPLPLRLRQRIRPVR
jgi:hypothetical protein